MFRRIASMTTLVPLAVLSSLLWVSPAAAQNQGYSVWQHRYDGGGGSYRSSYVPSTSYYSPAPAVNTATPVTQSVSYYYSPANDSVTLNFTVPGDAKISFGGTPTAVTGTRRQFVSPPIQPGREYTYDLQVSWKQDGREVTRTRQITVHAGDVVNLTFPLE